MEPWLLICEDFGSHERMFIIPKAFPIEFSRVVVAVVRKNEAPIARVAKDFGILRILFATLVEAGRHRRG